MYTKNRNAHKAYKCTQRIQMHMKNINVPTQNIKTYTKE